MIIFDLSCDNNHTFEGWFRNSEEFQNQLDRRLVVCPQCDSHAIRRVPSAVAIASGASDDRRDIDNRETITTNTRKSNNALMPSGMQVQALYRQFIQAVVSHSEDVGPLFAAEARKIHYNEAPERPIRGHATQEECDALADEGIEVVHLPMVSDDELN